MNTPEASKQTVRDSIQVVWVGHDLSALPRFWTEDCLNHAASPGADRGLEALHAYHAQFMTTFSAFTGMQIEVLQQIAEADRVVTHLLTRATHHGTFMGVPATGRTVSLATIRIDRLAEGKIAEHWSVGDLAGLMQQIRAKLGKADHALQRNVAGRAMPDPCQSSACIR